MSRIYFIRHAQASYLSDNYDRLSELGEKQSGYLGKYLHTHGVDFDRYYVGPLHRQRQTLEIVSDIYHQNGRIQPEADEMHHFREHDGPKALRVEYENLIANDELVKNWHNEIEADPGLKRKNSLKVFEHFIVKWTTGQYAVNHPEVQPWMEFRESVKEGIDTILTQVNKGEVVGVFTSGGTISAIMAEALGIHDQAKVAELNFLVRNTSITQFEYSRNKFNLLSFNEMPHLPKELITYV